MKQLVFSFLLVLFTPLHIYSQDCPEGNVTLASQEEVNQFIIDYPNCTRIYGDLKIGQCFENLTLICPTDIVDLSPLSNINQIDKSLLIFNTLNLTSLLGLENLENLNGAIRIVNSFSLDDISVLNPLVNKSTYFLLLNVAIEDLEVFAGLDTIKTNLSISYLQDLKSLKGLESTRVIKGECSISSLNRIKNLDYLNNLEIVDQLRIGFCDSLQSLDGLESLFEVTEYLQLYYNDQLENIQGLENLQRAGNITFSRLSSLTSLNGLENLERIDGKLVFQSLFNIVDLNPLENLINVGIGIRMVSNDALKDISGLRNVDPNFMMPVESDQNFVMLKNQNLSNCAIESVCHILHDESLSSRFLDNSSGCSSNEEVLSFCTVNTGIIPINNSIVVYPNPTDRYISFENLPKEVKEVQIVNTVGHSVLISLNNSNQIDLNEFPKGLYTLVIELGKENILVKVLKI